MESGTAPPPRCCVRCLSRSFARKFFTHASKNERNRPRRWSASRKYSFSRNRSKNPCVRSFAAPDAAGERRGDEQRPAGADGTPLELLHACYQQGRVGFRRPIVRLGGNRERSHRQNGDQEHRQAFHNSFTDLSFHLLFLSLRLISPLASEPTKNDALDFSSLSYSNRPQEDGFTSNEVTAAEGDRIIRNPRHDRKSAECIRLGRPTGLHHPMH